MRGHAKIKILAQNLRKGMTKEERKLWYDFLKDLPYTIHRQKVFGRYIADFYCAQARVVIEIDGSQHYEEEAQEEDRQRDEYFSNLEIQVRRYTNKEVREHFQEVCEDLLRIFSERM